MIVKMTAIDLYRNIGYLSYAIATSNNSISRDSIRLMKNELIKIWYSVEESHSPLDDNDAYVQIELIFNWLLSHGMSSKFAMKSFQEFVTKNQNNMSDSLKKSIIRYTELLTQKLFPNNQSQDALGDIEQMLLTA